MASNSYYGTDGGSNSANQQLQQPSNQTYGANYGSNDQTYGQGPSGGYGGYGGYSDSGYQGYGPGGAAPSSQTYAQQGTEITYSDGTRDQKYDAEGNPVLPNGERGLLTDLAGAGAGAYFGHKQGHGILGALAGGIGAHLLSSALGGGNSNSNKHHGYNSHHGGGGGGGMMGNVAGGMLGGLGGSMIGNMMGGGGRRRDMDGNEVPEQQQQQQQQQQQYGYGQIDGQGSAAAAYASGYDQNQQQQQGGYGSGGGGYGGQQAPSGDYTQDPNAAYGANYGR